MLTDGCILKSLYLERKSMQNDKKLLIVQSVFLPENQNKATILIALLYSEIRP